MSNLRVRSVLLLVLALLGTALAVAPQPATAAGPTTTSYFTMFGTPQQHPGRIFLTASSGPYLKQLDWSGWGDDAAVATGIYRSDCASCSPPKRRTATVRFSKPISCGDGVQAYSKGVVTVSKPDRGRSGTTFRIPMGCAPE